MADIIRLVQGDEKPEIHLTLSDENTGLALDLSAEETTVSIKFRAAGSTTLLSTIACVKTDDSSGKVSFDFAGGVLDVEPGMYEGEIEVNYAGQTQTVYDVLRFRVRQAF